MKLIMLGHDPGNPQELLVPMARVLHVPQRGTTLKDIAELPHRLGGRDVKPRQPVAFRRPDGGVTLLPGLGVTEAAELQDLAYAVEERSRRTADWRERFGFPSRETLHERIREHMAEKARYFKRHAVTCPGESKRERRLF